MTRGTHDVYLLDHHLVGLEGTDLLEQAISAGCTQPIVMLTGREDTTLDTKALSLGAADFVPKAELSPALLERVLRYAIVHARTVASIRHRALHDELTGLANRTLFLERLERAVIQARRNREFSFALLYLDLDGFKPINDTYGHAVGDRLLHVIAERLTQGRRESDTVARLGGDEFAMLLPGVDRAEAATALATRTAQRLSAPVTINNATVEVGASVGIRLARGGQLDAASLLADADEAMYCAKQRGGARPVIAPMQSDEWSSTATASQPRALHHPALCFVPNDTSDGSWRAVNDRSTIAIGHQTSTDRARENLRQCLHQLAAWGPHRDAPQRLLVAMRVSPRQARDIATNLDEDLSCHQLAGAGLVLEVADPDVLEAMRSVLSDAAVEVVLSDSATAMAG